MAPIFGLVLLGYGAARGGLFDEAGTRGLSLFVFNFAVPVMLMRTLAGAALPSGVDWGLLVSYFGSAFLVFGLGALAARRLFRREGADPGIFGITAAFSNLVILGTPLVLTGFGEQVAVPLFTLIAVHSPPLFTLTSIVAERGRGGGLSPGALWLSVAKGLLGNPILWGLGAGLALNLAGLALPTLVDRMAAMLGGTALPCALFALGANLSRFRLGSTIREALLLTVLKTLLQPALVFAAATLLRLPWTSVQVLVTVAAMPTGINAYLFAARYEAAVAEASSAILISTGLSIATLSILIAALR